MDLEWLIDRLQTSGHVTLEIGSATKEYANLNFELYPSQLTIVQIVEIK